MSERLVLLPGWGLDAAALQPLAMALSGSLQVEIQPLPLTAGDGWASWLSELDGRLAEDAWLAGWSLGGMLAAALAARRGARCPGLVTLASNACFVERDSWTAAMAASTFAAFRTGCAQSPAATLKRFTLLCAQGSDAARALGRQLQVLTTPLEAQQLRAGLEVLGALDNRAALAAFAGPQLHLFAEQDALVPATAADALLALLPSGEVDVLEGCGHAFVMEQAQSVAALIQEFVAQAAGPERHGAPAASRPATPWAVS